MRKFALIISLVVVFSSILSVCACATSLTAGVESLLETNEVYIAIPEEYVYTPFYEDDLYFVYTDDEYNYIYVDMQENTKVNEGITKLSEKEIKDLFIVNFLLEGDEAYYDYYDVNFSKCDVVTLNGVKAYFLAGDYAWIEEGMTEEDIYRSGFNCYITATKENIYFVAIVDDEGVFDEDEDMKTLMNTVCVNGTFFDGDKSTVKHDFNSYLPYSQVLQDQLSYYFENYEDPLDNIEMESADGYLYPEMFSEETGKYFVIAGIVIAVVTFIPTLIVLIISIVLIIKYSKNKKKLNEMEKQFGASINAGNMYQPYTAQSVAQPYGVQAAQSVYQPVNSQPVPQPVNTQVTEQKTILNGEIQDDNQK